MIARNFDEDDMTEPADSKGKSTSKAIDKTAAQKHWYSVPEPVRRVFDQFPLTVYKENTSPQRTKRKNHKHTLYIFTNPFGDSESNWSCNPACLKWQAYLSFNNIDFDVFGSNNHASPSGSLPFLQPARTSNDSSPHPLTTGKIVRWISQQSMQEEESLSTRHHAYMALIDQNIRNSWLYHLYLVKSNFEAVARPLYVSTASSNRFVRMSIAHSLREAAQLELLKSRNIIDKEEVYEAAETAFKALSTLLGNRQYFFNNDRPGLFDASVFAYTYLLLDSSLPWSDRTLSDMLQSHPQLVQHRNRLMSRCMQS